MRYEAGVRGELLVAEGEDLIATEGDATSISLGLTSALSAVVAERARCIA